MPIEHCLVGERRREVLIEIHHHLRDAPFGGLDARDFKAESKLLTKRGLHAVPVEDFSFDFRGLDGFVADKLDLEGFLVVRSYMLASTDKLSRLQQKLLLQGL